MNQNRAEFLEKFQGQNNNYKPTDNNQKGRWNQLYNHSKLRKMKEEVYRKKAIEERENELLTECTFKPKLTNNPKYYKNNYLLTYQNTQPKETNGQAYTPSITERQETWLQKKAMKMEQIKQYENNLELMECHFKPTIVSSLYLNNKIQNSGNKSLGRIGYGQTAEDILEDPESYNIYVNRQKNKRQEEEKKTQREKSLPGSGYLWKNKPRNYNPNYDYTKHEISKRDIPFSKSIKSLNKVLV